jgi:hypothetical protein
MLLHGPTVFCAPTSTKMKGRDMMTSQQRQQINWWVHMIMTSQQIINPKVVRIVLSCAHFIVFKNIAPIILQPYIHEWMHANQRYRLIYRMRR